MFNSLGIAGWKKKLESLRVASETAFSSVEKVHGLAEEKKQRVWRKHLDKIQLGRFPSSERGLEAWARSCTQV